MRKRWGLQTVQKLDFLLRMGVKLCQDQPPKNSLADRSQPLAVSSTYSEEESDTGITNS